jgi:decaprenylphospho-beta-D-ribofuranose 2-oxidase
VIRISRAGNGTDQGDDLTMPLPGIAADLTNWSLTARSSCRLVKARDALMAGRDSSRPYTAEIRQVLAAARAHQLAVIPRGAGHSYTDAALNTDGVVIDMTGMRRILAWEPERGIMRVEPGVTVREVVRVALASGWWPAVTPSTAEATIGGCAAMNVTGKNAWHCGAFGEHILSLTVLLASGEERTLTPEREPHLFRAFVGSAGLLGLITSITLQLRRIASSRVVVRARPAASFGEILALFQEERDADFLEAWVDGYAVGDQLGRGILTRATFDGDGPSRPLSSPSHLADPLMTGLARGAAALCRPALVPGVRLANRAAHWWGDHWGKGGIRRQSLFHSTFYPPALFAGYQALLPHGVETFQAFVPHDQVAALFPAIMRRSHARGFFPLWCVIKRHRPDPFLLSYQVGGFSLELNYPIIPPTAPELRALLCELTEMVVAAGGRFYLAKDALLTPALYRRSVGDAALDTFLHLKQVYDPAMLFQSDLFRRLFMGE